MKRQDSKSDNKSEKTPAGFNLALFMANLDGRVLAALQTVPAELPFSEVAKMAGVTEYQAHRSSERLIFRVKGVTWPDLEC